MAPIKPLQDLLLILLYVLYLVTVDMLVGLPGHQSRLRESDSRRMIQANVGSNCPSCFRGEEIFIKVNDFHVTIFGQIFYFL